MSLTDAERKDLARAREILETPTFGMRILTLAGAPIEMGVENLPAPVADKIMQVSRAALDRCLRTAVSTLRHSRRNKPSDTLHMSLAALSGGIGGAFGLPALALELPISTVIMFRSIAEIARSLGEDLEEPEALLNCLEVFALGGRSKGDDAAETSYFAIRAGLAQAVREASAHLASKGIGSRAASPALIRLTEAIAGRFGYAVSEKLVAASVPVFGAFGGAAINAVFMDHFQNMAWAHFTVRALERKHGPDEVKEAWSGS
ncbi:MAG: EcsC family protein [FCB group bacterium]|jgi:hypothetical protein|nr:EcsC family protein [FCB group bacterium]